MRSLPAPLAICVFSMVLLVDAIWLLIEGIGIYVHDPRIILFLLAPPTYIFLNSFLTPKGQLLHQIIRRLEATLLGLAFFAVAWMAAATLNHLLMTTAFPYADAMLAAWDKAIGFDWLLYFNLASEMPFIESVFIQCYGMFMPVSMLSFIILALTDNLRRAEFLIEAFFLTSVVCIVSGTFFPAEGASAYFLRGTVPEDMVKFLPGLYHLEALYALRDQQLTEIDPTRLKGLVTFPSFHTAGGVVVATVFWGTWWFWPVATYTALMIASTPIHGAHYMIDVVAGVVVAALVMIALASLPRYRGVLNGVRLATHERV